MGVCVFVHESVGATRKRVISYDSSLNCFLSVEVAQ